MDLISELKEFVDPHVDRERMSPAVPGKRTIFDIGRQPFHENIQIIVTI